MTRSLFATLAGIAAITAPAFAQAQDASSTVSLSGTVDEACFLGSPDVETLDLDDITGPDGRLDTSLTGAAVVATATIADAWCNSPSILSINGAPLTLQAAPAYATPAGFARQTTYNATLVGWPSDLVDRPIEGDLAKTQAATEARAAPTPGLVLNISDLETLAPGGTVETPELVLEAGAYSAEIVISVSLN